MNLEQIKELPICQVIYRDLCQHEKDVHDIETSNCKILEIFGRTIVEPDDHENIKIISTLDLDDGGDSLWLVVPVTDVIKIIELQKGKTLYDKKVKTKTKPRLKKKKR